MVMDAIIGATTALKAVAEMAKALRNAEMNEKVADLQIRLMEITQELPQKDQALKEANDALSFKKKTVFRNNVVWAESEKDPYCPRCFEADRKTVHLTWYHTTYYKCPNCDKAYEAATPGRSAHAGGQVVTDYNPFDDDREVI